MATRRKRKKSQTDLAPKAVRGKEADSIKGGLPLLLSNLPNLLRMITDEHKTIVGNIR